MIALVKNLLQTFLFTLVKNSLKTQPPFLSIRAIRKSDDGH